MQLECEFTVREADKNLVVRESSRYKIERFPEVQYVNENYVVTEARWIVQSLSVHIDETLDVMCAAIKQMYGESARIRIFCCAKQYKGVLGMCQLEDLRKLTEEHAMIDFEAVFKTSVYQPKNSAGENELCKVFRKILPI
jgi:hypothetical protein